jgi:hypothetical protein
MRGSVRFRTPIPGGGGRARMWLRLGVLGAAPGLTAQLEAGW